MSVIRKKYGNSAKIVWLISEESKDLLKYNELIDEILVYNQDTILRLQQEKFDILYCPEISPPSTLVSNIIDAEEKIGFYFNKDSHPSYFNEEAKEYLDTVFSNKINMKTRKTYQEMLFKSLKLQYEKERYTLSLKEKEVGYAKELLRNYNNKKIIGINVGAGKRWPSKSWHKSKIIELIRKVKKETDYEILILGGKEEYDIKKEIIEILKKDNVEILQNDSNNTLREYASVISMCNILITNDSLALHLAIALNKRTIALFFCTPPWQIETYNIVKTISSKMLEKYFMDNGYYEDLVNSITAEEVFKEI